MCATSFISRKVELSLSCAYGFCAIIELALELKIFRTFGL